MRTQIDTVVKGSNGKWAISFETLNGTPGAEYVMCNSRGAYVFSTEDIAWNAAHRALNILEQTGKFPNLCEIF